jgi:predicted transcriptional regulator
VNTIAGDLHISKRTVFRALHDLEEAGMLVRQNRHRSHGGLSSNLYKLGGGGNV